jgi:hypothetical protein
MNKPQIRVAVTMVTEWAIRRPYVFRYMPEVYVDAFFSDGVLRLSSFSAFSKHEDEQRLDKNEGSGTVVNIDDEGTGQTVLAAMRQGHDAYLLCGSTNYSNGLAEVFCTDSGFLINDPTSFGCTIAQAIPGFRSGLEGACIYLDKKTVSRKAGKLDFDSMKVSPDKNELDMGKMFNAISSIAGDDLFFLKHTRYQHQAEYRLLWLTGHEVPDFVVVKCPEAVQFCTRFEDL